MGNNHQGFMLVFGNGRNGVVRGWSASGSPRTWQLGHELGWKANYPALAARSHRVWPTFSD
jgi:hypothetical protein